MAMPESLIQDWERLNAQNRQQAQSYIRLLLDRQCNTQKRENPPRRLGILSHRFHSIAPDFDDPLPDFEEYMQ